MDLSWLKTVAPTIATALGGPFAGLAVTALGKAFGIDAATQAEMTDKVNSVLQSNQMTGEQLTQLRMAEMEMQKFEGEQTFKFADLEVKDRDSARTREATVKDSTNKVLAYTIVGSFIAVVGASVLGYAKIDSVLAGTLVGYLSAKAEQVCGYYFGSTQGSWAKTQLVAKAAAGDKQLP